MTLEIPTAPLRAAREALIALAAASLAAHAVGCVEPPERPAPSPSSSAAEARAPAPPVAMIAARGPTRLLPARPEPGGAAGRGRVCSMRRAVCVHAAAGVPMPAVARALGAAEHALDGLIALRLPLPRADFDAGGGPELDVYLDPERPAAAAIVDLAHLPQTWDLGPAFVVAPPLEGAGCRDDALLATAIAEAALLGLDAGLERSLAAGAASHLASLIAPCGVVEIASVDALQRAPERGFAIDENAGSEADRGGRLFFAWLEERHGSGRPGELTASLVAAAPQHTPPGSTWFRNEPDVVDVLVENARAGGSPPFGELLRDFAVARAFVGSRSDDAHLTDVARYGDLGRVRFDWSVTWASLPRSLAPARAILPTGATYVWVDLRDAPGGVPLTVVATWEPPSSFRWAVVKVGLEGEERGRIEPPTQLGSTSIQQSLVDLNGLAGLVVIGVNEGGSSAIDPHDPDDGPFAGQGTTLTLYPE